jgi:hypothetical protein
MVYLVWFVISTPFIGTVKGQAVDADVYITKYLTKMVKFIKNHHKNDKTMFWYDVSSCHCAQKVLEWLEQKKSKWGPTDSPLNVFQAQPIEIFLALLCSLWQKMGSKK